MSYPVLEIAQKIINKTQPELGDVITNLKLQKLLYYMQGYHLAVFSSPLFDEDIEAWMYGPVVPCVYDAYKSFGSSVLPKIESTESMLSLSEEEEALFDEVYDVYGQYSATKLMQMTHEEMPWKTTPTGVGSIIKQEKLRRYFTTQLSDE